MTTGPTDGSIVVRTAREGRAAKMGHDLVIDVTGWTAALDGDTLTLEVDPRSLVVREGVGGLKPLSDGDRARIGRTIAQKVLRGLPIAFRSTDVSRARDAVTVAGELTLAGQTRSLRVELRVGADGVARATIPLSQADWGITPPSVMMGALRVRDRVDVDVEARLPPNA